MTNKKINIAYVIDRFAIGGTENQLIDLIHNLDKSKFKIYLICLQASDYLINLELPCEKIILNVTSLASIHSICKLIYFSIWLRRKRINIIQSFFFDATLFSLIASKILPGIKVISSKRDLGYWYTPQLLKILIRMSYFIDLYLVNSFAIRDVVTKKERVKLDKVKVIYNGIKRPRIILKELKKSIKENYCLNENDTIIGIVANLNRPVKRIELFIQAASILLKKYDNLKFIIVGGGHLKSELLQMCIDLNVEKKVTFAGLQADPQPFISIFDIGVLCSDSEGFSNSIIEYMTYGVPVIATKTGGNKEIITDNVNGFLFEPGDFVFLAKHIENLIENRQLYNSISKNNLKVSSKFFWEKIIKKHEHIYHSLVKR